MNMIHFHAGLFQANCYVLWKDDEALVIDPGGSYDRIVAEVRAIGAEIKAVLLTHGHFDHAGAAARLQREGAKVYVHEYDYDKCFTDKNLSKYFVGVQFDAFTPDCTVRDGDVLSLCGYEIKVLHTPGHTEGGVCYIIEDCIFSGDTLFNGSIGRTDLEGGDLEALLDSIGRKLYAMDRDYVVWPGHMQSTTLFAERDKNNFKLWSK